jgi:hypothetical protein
VKIDVLEARSRIWDAIKPRSMSGSDGPPRPHPAFAVMEGFDALLTYLVEQCERQESITLTIEVK